MTDPTVEEVREALDSFYGCTCSSSDDAIRVEIFMTASRLFVDTAEPDIQAMRNLIHAEICVDRCVGWHDGTALLAAAFGDNNLIRRADR